MTEVGYASDKPSDCAYCYFFSAGRKKCKRKECFYRISSPPLRRKVTHWEPCEGCPYGKHSPCLGYCIVNGYERSEGASEHRIIHMNFRIITVKKRNPILFTVCLKSFLPIRSLRAFPVKRNCFMDFCLTVCSYL